MDERARWPDSWRDELRRRNPFFVGIAGVCLLVVPFLPWEFSPFALVFYFLAWCYWDLSAD